MHFFSVFFSVFSVSSFAQTCEHQRAGGFQTRTLPCVCAQSQKNRKSVQANSARAMLSLFWQFHGFPLLLMVVGWVFGFLFSSFSHIANCPKGNTPETPSSQGPQTTAVNSNGAAQSSPWCSRSASMPSVLLSECRAAKATLQGWAELLSHSFSPKAEAERVPFLPKAGAQLKASAHLHKREGHRKRESGVDTAQIFRRHLSWELLVTRLKNLITCLSGASESHTSSPRQGPKKGACEGFLIPFSKCLPALMSS